VHDDVRRLRDLAPCALEVSERLGDHEAGVVGELVQDRVVGYWCSRVATSVLWNSDRELWALE
jgi:hypothetical protein